MILYYFDTTGVDGTQGHISYRRTVLGRRRARGQRRLCAPEQVFKLNSAVDHVTATGVVRRSLYGKKEITSKVSDNFKERN